MRRECRRHHAWTRAVARNWPFRHSGLSFRLSALDLRFARTRGASVLQDVRRDREFSHAGLELCRHVCAPLGAKRGAELFSSRSAACGPFKSASQLLHTIGSKKCLDGLADKQKRSILQVGWRRRLAVTPANLLLSSWRHLPRLRSLPMPCFCKRARTLRLFFPLGHCCSMR